LEDQVVSLLEFLALVQTLPVLRSVSLTQSGTAPRSAMSERAAISVSTHRGSDFAGLLREVRQAGLLERRKVYYAAKIGVTAALLAAGLALFGLLGDSWWQLAIAGYLGLVFVQIGFVGHDAGHHQILRDGRNNALIGLIHADLLIGLSFSWWVDKHSRHHAHPNEVGRDPDIATGALVFTAGQAGACHGFRRLAARYQAWYFFPLLSLEGLNLHVASVKSLFARSRGRLAETGLLAVHFAAYAGVILYFLPPAKAVAFIAVNQALFGIYLGCAFAPNHKGMPALSDQDAADFLRRQVLTSRNVRGGPVTDWVLGGLNYQIEHHLFPSMPRPNLKRAQQLVRAYCADHGVAYRECSALESYSQALRHLRAVGAAVGAPGPATGA
jgi:fatty acid desaturase